MKRIAIDALSEFEWDQGNVPKIKRRHEVDPPECEEIFRNRPFVMPDDKHSQAETRYIAYGHTSVDRKLMLVFTMRHGKIRVLSARPMDRKERKWYGEQEA